MINTYYVSNGNFPLSEHFALTEFQCKNGNDEVKVSDVLVEKLEKLRDYLGASSIIINSGYRTPDYSVTVGGGAEDPHTKGIAADIYAYRDSELISGAEICCAAQTIGFNGIGYMGNAVHVDVRGDEEYFNNHWSGNEQNGENVSDWYEYFGMARPVDIEDCIAESEVKVMVEVNMVSKGSKGGTVRALQGILNAKGYDCGYADGDFGDNTYSAVVRFQRNNGLAADGVVGHDTWTALLG